MLPAYKRLAIDTDLSMIPVREAVILAQKEGIEPDTLFVSHEEFGLAKEVLDLLYTHAGIALNRVFLPLPAGTWVVGRNSPLFTYGSPGA